MCRNNISYLLVIVLTVLVTSEAFAGCEYRLVNKHVYNSYKGQYEYQYVNEYVCGGVTAKSLEADRLKTERQEILNRPRKPKESAYEQVKRDLELEHNTRMQGINSTR